MDAAVRAAAAREDRRAAARLAADGERPGGAAKEADNVVVEAEVRGEVDEIPRRHGESVEGRRIAADNGEGAGRPAALEETFEERDEVVLGLVAEQGVDLRVGGEDVFGGRVDDVLSALIEVAEDDRRVGAAGAERLEDRSEERIARRRPVERGEGEDDGVGVGRDALKDGGVRRAEADVASRGGVKRLERGARDRERVDERSLVANLADHGRRLNGAEVGEVGVVDEVPRDPERGEDDRDAGHRIYRIRETCGWR
jgi:hypothetical protein